MVLESLDKGWKAWSAKVAELQLLRADHENRKKQGWGFFKMDKAEITTVQEELAKDLYGLSTSHMEQIAKLMEDYDDHHMATAMWLDAYERER